MQSINKIIGGVLVSALIFSGGFLAGYLYKQPAPAGGIIQGEIVQNIIGKNPANLPIAEKDKELKCFYQSNFILDIKQKDNTNSYVAYSALCGRSASREFTIPVAQSGNWKLYAGIAIGGVVVAGGIYGGYKLIKALK
jgi:hypothetical protein